MKGDIFNATITAFERITDDLAICKIRPDNGVPSFIPGQYVALGVCECCAGPDDDGCNRTSCHYSTENRKVRLVKRAYSIASPPSNREYLEFFINLLPDGAFTTRLARLEPGARIHVVQKIVGSFTLLEAPVSRNLVFIATGTGLAPFISMLRDDTVRRYPRVSLIHGARHAIDLAYAEEMRELQHNLDTFSYFPVVSREKGGKRFSHGHVQDILFGGAVGIDPLRDHIFLCGNPGMVEEIQALLDPHGFKVHSKQEPGNLHLEKYW